MVHVRPHGSIARDRRDGDSVCEAADVEGLECIECGKDALHGARLRLMVGQTEDIVAMAAHGKCRAAVSAAHERWPTVVGRPLPRKHRGAA